MKLINELKNKLCHFPSKEENIIVFAKHNEVMASNRAQTLK